MTAFMRSTKHAFALVACAAIAAIALTACNTVSGMGKDIKSAGKAIERTGEQNK